MYVNETPSLELTENLRSDDKMPLLDRKKCGIIHGKGSTAAMLMEKNYCLAFPLRCHCEGEARGNLLLEGFVNNKR